MQYYVMTSMIANPNRLCVHILSTMAWKCCRCVQVFFLVLPLLQGSAGRVLAGTAYKRDAVTLVLLALDLRD
jgi:hypothetical protein